MDGGRQEEDQNLNLGKIFRAKIWNFQLHFKNRPQ